MVEYGFINENGCLTSKMLDMLIEKYRDAEGEIKDRIVTIEEQADILKADGWKPVDLIDENMMITEEGYSINITPYDAGDKISYQYVKVFDKRNVENKIQGLKKQLSVGDYKIIKCYEASLMKEMLPYDIEALRAERQSIRHEINRLEEILLNN